MSQPDATARELAELAEQIRTVKARAKARKPEGKPSDCQEGCKCGSGICGRTSFAQHPDLSTSEFTAGLEKLDRAVECAAPCCAARAAPAAS